MKVNNFFAFLGGALVGAAVAILLAPEAGEETRKKIKTSFNKEVNNLKDKINDFEIQTKKSLNNIVDNVINDEDLEEPVTETNINIE